MGYKVKMVEQIKPKNIEPAQKSQSDFRHIVRIVQTDIDGNKSTLYGITKIKGVSIMFANMVCSLTKIDKNKKLGDLSTDEIKKLDEAIKTPKKINAPIWMFNRRKDYETGEDNHIITSDLIFVKDNDLKRLKKLKTYRGIRHIFGLPSRGQRTKSNFRKNKGKVMGVKRKSGAKGGRV